MNATAIRNAMTPKQHEFASKLLREAVELIKERDALTATDPADTESVIEQHIHPLSAELEAGATRQRASQIIDLALDNNKVTRGEIDRLTVALGIVPEAPAARQQTFVTTGMYRVGDDIYKVLPSRNSDRHYAKKLTGFHWEDRLPVADVKDEDLKFTYAKGAMRLIRPEHRMPLDMEKAFGQLVGACIDCGKLLTHPKSIEYGKGPKCSDNYKH
jgi:Family of unknown function (DUF6011)